MYACPMHDDQQSLETSAKLIYVRHLKELEKVHKLFANPDARSMPAYGEHWSLD